MIKTTLTIDGMMCGMCESHVNDAIRGVCSVKKVVSSHKRGVSEILSDEAPDEAALRGAIEATGYHVLSYTSAPCEKRALFGRK